MPDKPPLNADAAPRQAKRGSRLSEDFAMPAEWLDAGNITRLNARLPSIDLACEAVKFVLYWQSRAGAGARKMDWRKTWLVWCLNIRSSDAQPRPEPSLLDFAAPHPAHRVPSHFDGCQCRVCANAGHA